MTTSVRAAPDANRQEADLLVRQLEAQLRRVLLATEPPDPRLQAAFSRWAERVSALAPEIRADAIAVADALHGLADAASGVRAATIAASLRTLAQTRSRLGGGAAGANGDASNATGAGREGPARDVGDRVTPTSPSPSAVARIPPPPAGGLLPPRAAAAPTAPTTRTPPTRQRKNAPLPRAAKAATKTSNWALSDSVETLPKYKREYAGALAKLGLRALGDLLRHFPRKHLDYSKLVPVSQVRPGEEVTVEVFVLHCEAVGPYRGRGRRVEATFTDATGTVRATWFGQPWRAKQLTPGLHVYLSGKVDVIGGRLQFTHPDYEKVTEREAVHTGRLVPVYPLSGEMPGSWLRDRMKWAVDNLAYLVDDPLPDPFRERWSLPPLHAAIQQMHFPESEAEFKAARHRLAFDDLFILQLGLLRQRREWQRLDAIPLPLPERRRDELLSRLPFVLTAGQRQALDDALRDIARDRPMGRLLQGDVGSGKTVVAALAALAAVENGCQAAIVAPTEVLAEQHARTLGKLFAAMAPFVKPVLITGSLSAKVRADAWKLVGSGQAQVVVGTHALFNAKGAFARLALVVIDEQHRFGVYQRDTLWRKGERPHLLAMTATPIPRTLALQLFGDLDLSVIDELPVGRLPIKTSYVGPERRPAVEAFVRREVAAGRQAYIICPLVDESDVVAAKSVKAEFERLRDEVFPDLRVGLVHGRLRPGEKDEAMRRFRDGETQVLVATTVIEVGVDVPNATVIVIEGADLFGLAQLHQLRGRVGRGLHQSYCALLASEGVDEEGEARLRIVERTANGFALAEADLQERGTGAFFGDAQSGKERLLRWVGFDGTEEARGGAAAQLLEARRAAEDLLAADPALTRPEHARLAGLVAAILPTPDAAQPESESASLAYV